MAKIDLVSLRKAEQELSKATISVRNECADIIFKVLCQMNNGEIDLLDINENDENEIMAELNTSFCDENGDYHSANVNKLKLACPKTKVNPTAEDILCVDEENECEERLAYMNIDIVMQIIDCLAYLYPQFFQMIDITDLD